MNSRFLSLALVIIIAVIAVGFYMNYQEEHKTAGDRVGAAMDKLGGGIKDSAREMEHRTPTEKMGDALHDAGDKLKQ